MTAPEGMTVGATVLALTDKGEPAVSARDATLLFVTWFLSNLSLTHPVTLTFSQGRLFALRLLRNGAEIWALPAPDAGEDVVQVVGPGEQFTLPINPAPSGPPGQSPVVPLRDILDGLGVPGDQEIDLEFSALIGPQPQVSMLRLWRA